MICLYCDILLSGVYLIEVFVLACFRLAYIFLLSESFLFYTKFLFIQQQNESIFVLLILKIVRQHDLLYKSYCHFSKLFKAVIIIVDNICIEIKPRF